MKTIQYSKLRDSVQNGFVFSFEGKWRVSKLITWWQRWKYPELFARMEDVSISHVGIAIWLTIGGVERLCAMESTGKGVNIYPLSYLLEKYNGVGGNIYLHVLKANTLDGEKIVTSALQKWGWAYPAQHQYFVLGSNIFRKLYNWFTGKDGDVDDKKVTCSEFVAQVYKDAGYVHNKIPALTSPIEVVNFTCLGEPILIEKD